MQKKFKLQLKHQMAEAFLECIKKVLTAYKPQDDDDAIWLSCLDELRLVLETRLLQYKPNYTFSIKPSLAFSIRILNNSFNRDTSTYLGNKLLQISNSIHKFYNL